MSSTLIFLRGLSGSGKTTMAQNYIRKNRNSIICSRDAIRKSIYNSTKPISDYEQIVSNIEETIIINGLVSGKTVLIDNLNIKAKYLDVYKNYIFKAIQNIPNGKIKLAVLDLTNIPLKKCLKQNKLKPNPIPENVIKKQQKELIKNQQEWYEKFDSLLKFGKPSYDETLPKCAIFDLDGTLRIVDKDPYDLSSVHTDTPNTPIIKLNTILSEAGYKIIICTGRNDAVKKETITWLNDNNIIFEDIHMRKDGDERDDAIIKGEMLEILKNKYCICYAVDDRNSVVDFWRRNNIPTLQVNYGNF